MMSHDSQDSIVFSKGRGTWIAALMVSTAIAGPAFAQAGEDRPQAQSNEGASGGEIIVTARKREETLLDVPASISALGTEDLDRYGTRDFWGLQNQVPNLIIQDIPSNSGGAVAMRGIGSSPNSQANERSVSISVDGIQPSLGAILRLGQIDLAQVEVLKGPQALFFGKNSPAGVVAFTTADPGSDFEAKASLDYEFGAKQIGATGIISGPITDNLGMRLAIYATHMRGYQKNDAQIIPGLALGPSTRWGPQREEFIVRHTTVWEPTDRIKLRAKYTFSSMDSDSGIADFQQRIVCPYGNAQIGPYSTLGVDPAAVDCKANELVTNGEMDPRLTLAMIASAPPATNSFSRRVNDILSRNGFQKTVQHLASLQADFDVTDGVTVTSLTGYYHVVDEFAGAFGYQNVTPLNSWNPSRRTEFSEELRVVTDWQDSIVNFTGGLYYQDTKLDVAFPNIIDLFVLGFAPTPFTAFAPSYEIFGQDHHAVSAFGQVLVKPMDRFEIAGGIRYTRERKQAFGEFFGTPALWDGQKLTFSNWSPEITVRYEIDQGLNIFGAWRNGYKSGGFNLASRAALAPTTDYKPEDAQGFDLGLKYESRSIRANLTLYTYKYSDLQVTTFEPSTITAKLLNAAAARLKGVEFDFTWQPPVDGLQIRGAVNYNHARYTKFISACYVGQLISQGCDQLLNPATGRYTSQDLAGRQLVLAPDWTANAGFTYETPVGGALKVGLTTDVLFSSSFDALLEAAPLARQKKYANVDASLHVGTEDDRWRLALIGRNLTNTFRARFVSQTPLTGNSTLTGTETPGGLPDYSGSVNRGREIRLQLTFRY